MLGSREARGAPAVRRPPPRGKEARTALRAARSLIGHRYPLAGPLANLAWTWRESLSFYDALYVALAVRLGAPRVTGDVRLSRAPELACTVEVI